MGATDAAALIGGAVTAAVMGDVVTATVTGVAGTLDAVSVGTEGSVDVTAPVAAVTADAALLTARDADAATDGLDGDATDALVAPVVAEAAMAADVTAAPVEGDGGVTGDEVDGARPEFAVAGELGGGAVPVWVAELVALDPGAAVVATVEAAPDAAVLVVPPALLEAGETLCPVGALSAAAAVDDGSDDAAPEPVAGTDDPGGVDVVVPGLPAATGTVTPGAVVAAAVAGPPLDATAGVVPLPAPVRTEVVAEPGAPAVGGAAGAVGEETAEVRGSAQACPVPSTKPATSARRATPPLDPTRRIPSEPFCNSRTDNASTSACRPEQLPCHDTHRQLAAWWPPVPCHNRCPRLRCADMKKEQAWASLLLIVRVRPD